MNLFTAPMGISAPSSHRESQGHRPSSSVTWLAAAACLLIGAAIPRPAAAWTFEVLHAFRGKEGYKPKGTPVVDAQGNLYGTTWVRGFRGQGTLWVIPAGGRLKGLHWFGGPREPGDGGLPTGALMIDKDGTIYGTTSRGGAAHAGTVFKYTPGTGYQLLASLPGGTGGSYVSGGIARDPDSGTIYGFTSQGGDPDCNCGTAFRIDAVTHTLETIYTFHGEDGKMPNAEPTLDGGTIYGTASSGGPDGWGTPFSMKSDGSDYFAYRHTKGTFFDSGLAKDAAGHFWGVAWDGIYEITPDGTYTWRHKFGRKGEGWSAFATPLIGKDGLLYGTTSAGGRRGLCGTIYQFDPATDTLKTLHEFRCGYDGSSISAGLAQDAAGNLYGVATLGGKYDRGTVFRLRP